MNTGTVHCAICNHALGGVVVTCDRCDAPYHGDCWEFGGGCAIYGCRKSESAVRVKVGRKGTARPLEKDASWRRQRSREGAVFGACLGLGVTLIGWLGIALIGMRLTRTWEVAELSAAWGACGVVLGLYAGGKLTGRDDRVRTVLLGLFGPGLTALGLCALCYIVALSPMFLAFSLPAVAFALPCTLLAERYNDPEALDATRRGLWLRLAKLLSLVGIGLVVLVCCVAR